MAEERFEAGWPWRRALVALAALAGLGILVFVMLGTQVSGILSTVGGSVPAFGGGIGQGEQPGGGSGGDPEGDPGGGGGTGSSGGSGEVPVLDVTRPDLLIIKTGAIAIQVEALDAGISSSNQLMSGLGGYVSSSERSGDEEGDQASVTYRIPAARWEDATDAVRKLGIKVLNERSSTEDVTTQVIDLGARIKNLRSTEAAFQAVMTRATKVNDILSVQGELTKVREQIETLTAEKTHLEGQAAYSTLTVTFALKPNPVLTQRQGFDAGTEVDRASAKLVRIAQRAATAGIWFGIVWLPVLATLGAAVAMFAWAARRIVRRPPVHISVTES